MSQQINSFVRVEVENERSYKTHFTARVLEDDFRVVGQTSEAVGRPHHSYVVDIHLGHAHDFRPTKALHTPSLRNVHHRHWVNVNVNVKCGFILRILVNKCYCCNTWASTS